MKIDLSQFTTIIFDFGGVILDINPELSINAFKALSNKQNLSSFNESDVLKSFERGEITREQLIETFNIQANTSISEQEFIEAWNAMLLDYKTERIEKIQQLAKTHKLLMLSNTNEVHFKYFSEKLHKEYGVTFNDLFNKVYLSHEMGLIKPNLEIYKQVIRDQNLRPNETLFIEDTEENTKAANELGIQTLLIPRNGSFYNYFKL